MRVEVVMTYFIQGQNQKSMFIKLHEGDDNNEVKKRAKRNVNDENYIWKGRRRKLLQTSSILTPILLKIGDMVDVAFDDINRYCKSKSRNRRS